jgi:hypothetical protein
MRIMGWKSPQMHRRYRANKANETSVFGRRPHIYRP